MARPLNPKQLKFAAGVVAGLTQADAYIAAGYSADRKAAEANAARLIRDDRVQQLLRPTRQAAEVARTQQVAAIEISRDRIRLELARLSFSDPRRLFHADGTLKGVPEWDDDTAAAVASVEVEEELVPGDDVGEELEGQPRGGALKRKRALAKAVRTTKLRFWNKPQALKLLGDTEAGVWVGDDKPDGGGGVSDGLAVLGRLAALLAARQPLPAREGGDSRVVAVAAEGGGAAGSVPVAGG